MVKAKYGNIKTVVDGHKFDSRAEASYYRWLKQNKDVVDIELQPRFILQSGFKKNGKTWRAITYVADFRVTITSGKQFIIDVKGIETSTFKIKMKMFEKVYPDLELVLVKGRDFKPLV